MLIRISEGWARFERTVASLLAVSITLLILLSVVTRALGSALFWVDELAIYAMAWMTFLGASCSVRYRHTVAVTIMTDIMPTPMKKVTASLVDLFIVVFAFFMLWLCWRWFNPLELARHGFVIEKFQETTFNFLYSELTTTLGIRKVWVWFIMWIFSLGITLHSLANLFANTTPKGEDVA